MPKPAPKLTPEVRRQLESLPVTGCIPCLVRGAVAVIIKLDEPRLQTLFNAGQSPVRPSQLQRELLTTDSGAVIRLVWDLIPSTLQPIRVTAYFNIADSQHGQMLKLLRRQDLIKLYFVESQRLQAALTLVWPWSAEARASLADLSERAEAYNRSLEKVDFPSALEIAREQGSARDEFGHETSQFWTGAALGFGRRGDSWIQVWPRDPASVGEDHDLLEVLDTGLFDKGMHWFTLDQVMRPGTGYPVGWEGVAGQYEDATVALFHPPGVTALEALQAIEDHMTDTRSAQPPLAACLALLAAEWAMRQRAHPENVNVGMHLLLAGAELLLGVDLRTEVLPEPVILPRPLQRTQVEAAAQQVIDSLRMLPADFTQQTVYDYEQVNPLLLMLAATGQSVQLRYSDMVRIVLEIARQLAVVQPAETVLAQPVDTRNVLLCLVQAMILLQSTQDRLDDLVTKNDADDQEESESFH